MAKLQGMSRWFRRSWIGVLLLALGAVVAWAVSRREPEPEQRAAAVRKAMVNDLLRLARAESLFYATHGTFTGDWVALGRPGRPFQPSRPVRLYIGAADRNGWWGVAANAWTEEVCRLARSAPGTVVRPEPAAPQCR